MTPMTTPLQTPITLCLYISHKLTTVVYPRCPQGPSHTSSIFNLQTHQVQNFQLKLILFKLGCPGPGTWFEELGKNLPHIFNLQTPQLKKKLKLKFFKLGCRNMKGESTWWVMTMYFNPRVSARTQGVCPYLYICI